MTLPIFLIELQERKGNYEGQLRLSVTTLINNDSTNNTLVLTSSKPAIFHTSLSGE